MKPLHYEVIALSTFLVACAGQSALALQIGQNYAGAAAALLRRHRDALRVLSRLPSRRWPS